MADTLDKKQEEYMVPDKPIKDEKNTTQEEAETIKCPHCEYENPKGQTLCLKCQLPLQLGAAVETKKLAPSPDEPGVPKWGSTVIEQQLYLHVEGSNEPIVLGLEEREYILGRRDPKTGSFPDVDLTNYQADKMGVSRKHACLSYKGKSMKISDLNSANHTYLNGYKLVPNQARIL